MIEKNKAFIQKLLIIISFCSLCLAPFVALFVQDMDIGRSVVIVMTILSIACYIFAYWIVPKIKVTTGADKPTVQQEEDSLIYWERLAKWCILFSIISGGLGVYQLIFVGDTKIIGWFFLIAVVFLCITFSLSIIFNLRLASKKPSELLQVKINFELIDDFINFLGNSCKENLYRAQPKVVIDQNYTLMLYTHEIGYDGLNYIALVLAKEWTDASLEIINNTITNKLYEFLDIKRLPSNLNMFLIVGVESQTKAFKELIMCPYDQDYRVGRIIAGIDLGKMDFLLANHRDLFLITKYWKVREMFLTILHMTFDKKNNKLENMP